MNSRWTRALATVALASALSASSAYAGPFTTAYFFGDSLSDTGNISALTGGAVPGSLYYNGRFSNGPVWVEHLAAGLGVPGAAAPLPQAGTNYAFGGARIDTGLVPPGILTQLGMLFNLPGELADPNALYVIAAGGNDMRDARSAFTGTTPADDAGRQAAANVAGLGLQNTLQFLASRGARHVLLMNLPDLGNTPEAVGLNLVTASRDASKRFNDLMPGLLAAGAGYGLDMSFLDAAGLMNAIITDALTNGGATYGIGNVFTPCGPFPGSVGAPCSASLFFDPLHPSAAAHKLLGEAALRAVPEPATLVLVTLGAIGAIRRRRAA